ncbi:hypothetical protein EMIHUDRAFT_440329 [Emiliania huxleyi CCMP1516]|uniref:Uncharacterized protein n=2 Tax=Emiliania huxleyi TaxID=2903 RepID=A0A0D3KPJ8_EMIH1|nr:hypothetical protein EMIHUDRAFT_440329 [Emiliania huxleyi CCMP1516]EOD37683.1 hypothetical protein EMIHUDRAFT_440329 [Emiliania huxleyi CCMP1516]|eukprot:XP_005790112.1 hypothetical protein EMIHUDRAFT_440329 [Emiliania huxleyi CCMP1516]
MALGCEVGWRHGAPTCCPSAFGGSSCSSRGAFGGVRTDHPPLAGLRRARLRRAVVRFFCVPPVDTGRWAMAGLVAGRASPSAGRGAEVRNRVGAAPARSLSGRRAHGSVARLVPH